MSVPASDDKVRPEDKARPADRIPLAGTGLFVAAEKDFTVRSGKEAAAIRRSRRDAAAGAADTVIGDALVVDHWGIVRADVGLKDGRIVGIGRAGDPDTQEDIGIVVGPATTLIDGAGRILTAGALDAFVPRIDPWQAGEALASGVTTLLAAPAPGGDGDDASAWNLARRIGDAGALPVNLAFLAAGAAPSQRALAERLEAGAAGIVLDAGRHAPATIDDCLPVADAFDVQLTVSTDSLSVPTLVDAVASRTGRTLHVCHDDGVWSPALARLCGLANALPSSALALPDADPGDDPARATIARLHDIGALSMIVSGSAAQGSVVAAAFRAAAAMKARRGPLPEDSGGNDNFRVRRYLAKVTINPAIAHGLDEWVGSIEIGKCADLVLWSPASFAVRPDVVIKLGVVVAPSLPAADARRSSVAFVSQASLDLGIAESLAGGHTLLPVRNTRSVSKESMVHNSALPAVEIDPATGAVRLDGELLAPAPAD